MKPKMVKAWAFAVDGVGVVSAWNRKIDAAACQEQWMKEGYDCGPIVRIEVPAPVKARKERKS